MIPLRLDLRRLTLIPYPVALVGDLERRGHTRIRAMGEDLVVHWNGGRPRVWLDRCPHLGMPLSLGSWDGGTRVRCRYHGWAYDTVDGAVVDQPTLPKAEPCRLEARGAIRLGDFVFSWIGDPGADEEVRARLPAEVWSGASHLRFRFDSPFPLALFSSVDYAHFGYHTGFRPLYALYSKLRDNRHQPGTGFAPRIVEEHDHHFVVRYEEADRTVRVWATATEMDDGSVNCFQTFVTPIDEQTTIYWEGYRPRSESPLLRTAARSVFHTVTRAVLGLEDRRWTAAVARPFAEGRNIHLSANDVVLGAHLRRWCR